MSRKPRSDSPLKTLSPERQAELIEKLRSHSHTEVRKWLAETHGLKTSVTALSEFWSWWHLRDRLQRREVLINGILDQIKTRAPSVSDDDLFSFGQAIFSAEAIEDKDPSSWAQIQKLRLKRVDQEQAARKIALLERKAALAEQAEKVTAATDMTPEQKQDALRAIFGMT
jgi:hypothetical protein